MQDYFQKTCPKCGQKLRFPKDLGGIVMACPSCGHKFHSDFKLGGVKKSANRGVGMTLFELPTTILRSLGRYFSK